MTTAELEHRVAAIERKLAAMSAKRPTNKEWVLRMWGSFADDPDFEKAMQFGREWRQAENRKSLRGEKSERRKKNRK